MSKQHIAQRRNKKGIFYYLLWFVGWIIFFPLPATILVLRSKKIPIIFKGIALTIIWIVGLALVNSLRDSNSVKSTGTVLAENESEKESNMTEVNIQSNAAESAGSNETDADLETNYFAEETNKGETEPIVQAASEVIDSDSKSFLSEIADFGSSSAIGEEKSEVTEEVYCEDEGINDYIIKYNHHASFPIEKASISENYAKVVSSSFYDNGDTKITFGHGMEDVSVAFDCYGIDIEMVKQILYDLVSVQNTEIAKNDIDVVLDEIRAKNMMSAYNLREFNNVRCDISYFPAEEGKRKETWKITIT